MKIWIDGYEANTPNRVGSGQIAINLLQNLEAIDKENEYTVLLPNKPLDDLPKERSGWKYRVLKPSKLWTRIALPAALYLSKNKPDVFFTPTHYLPRFSPVKTVCTIFDLAFLHFPEMFDKKDLFKLVNWTKLSIRDANHIVTISEFSKQDIIKQYKVDKSKVTIAFPGFDENFFNPAKKADIVKVLDKYKIKDNYIIYIGTMQPRKNLVRLIEAFSKVEDKSLQLVLVGKTTGPGRQGWKFQEILEAPVKFGVEDRVIFTGFAPTEDLPPLLTGSKAFVLPSLWEGFGIPIVEAMASGTAVIVSNVSSLPEVAAEAGTLIDPYSVESIKEAIERLLKDDKLREKKVQLGYSQVKKFTWESCAKSVLEVLKSV
jgi:glycosyltransferase involved in cell wall biosynthesis